MDALQHNSFQIETRSTVKASTDSLYNTLWTYVSKIKKWALVRFSNQNGICLDFKGSDNTFYSIIRQYERFFKTQLQNSKQDPEHKFKIKL
jgi:hypothetical protein